MLEDTAPPPQDLENYSILCDPGAQFLCYAVVIFPCAIIGLILGCMANSRAKAVGLKNGFATAGIITSVIGLVMVLLSLVFFIFLFDTIESGYYYDYYYFIKSLIV